MPGQRIKGYVVGCDKSGTGKKVCKVRIKDASSHLDGKKLIIASVHNDVELGQGLNVNFLIGTVDGKENMPEHRAVDVRLESPPQEETDSKNVKRS